MEIKLNYLPERTVKPRTKGFTIIQDNGLSLKNIEDFISTSGQLVDYVRILPDALFSNENLLNRIKKYQEADIIPFISGIIFEAAYVRNDINSYLELVKSNGIGHIEVSDGVFEILPEEKTKIIKELSKSFKVFSKIGSKYRNSFFPIKQWKESIISDLEAGSEKIIVEGSEAGTAKIIAGVIDINVNFVNNIKDYTDMKDIIWEAPYQKQQVWFINNFGANVNLSNITPENVLKIESQRMGLHFETIKQNLPESLIQGKLRKTDPMLDIDFQI